MKSHSLTRRQLLVRGLGAASAAALLPLLGDSVQAAPSSAASALRPAPGTPITVRLAEVVQETRADFAAGQAQGVDLPREGGASGLTAGPEGGIFTSAVLTTEFPASHVGLHWRSEGDEVGFELRTSRDGSRWSRWQAISLEAGKDETPRGETFGALVGARGATLLQYRATFPASSAAELWRVTLTYLDAQPRSGSTALGSLLAGPADFRDQIVPREAWGADESLRFEPDGTEIWPRAYVPVKKVVVHHTATTNDYADGAAEVRAIYTYHAESLGWGDIGYHLLIDQAGQVYEGRRGREQDPEERSSREIASRDVVAGHVTNFNFGTTSVALIGDFNQVPLPDVMRDRLEEALAFECDRHGIDPLGQSDFLLQNDLWRDTVPDVPGHRDCTPHTCPGQHVYALLEGVRRRVADRLALNDRPRPGPVTLEQGRNPWPGSLSFAWQGPLGAQFSTFLEGWYRLPGHDEIIELSGYTPETSLPAWSDWTRATSASFDIAPEAHGHYTLHVRTRTAPGVESVAWSRFSALVEPQIPVDNADDGRTVAVGAWPREADFREYYGHDYAYSTSGSGERVFRWRIPVPRTGLYAVQACWIALEHLAKEAPFAVSTDGRALAEARVDQTSNSFSWQTLATVALAAGQTCEVALSNAAAGTVIADAVRLLLV